MKTTIRHNVTFYRRRYRLCPVFRQRPRQHDTNKRTTNTRRGTKHGTFRQTRHPRPRTLPRVRQRRHYHHFNTLRRHPYHTLTTRPIYPNNNGFRRPNKRLHANARQQYGRATTLRLPTSRPTTRYHYYNNVNNRKRRRRHHPNYTPHLTYNRRPRRLNAKAMRPHPTTTRRYGGFFNKGPPRLPLAQRITCLSRLRFLHSIILSGDVQGATYGPTQGDTPRTRGSIRQGILTRRLPSKLYGT